MIKETISFYCDDCEKEIATVDNTSGGGVVNLIALGIFERPRGDKGHLCRNCMLKTLSDWRAELRGH